jgi:branched-chain amino acid transport system ATP-binding protein
MSAPALAAKGLNKSFGGIHVTRNVDLVLPVGARHALIGPNGAGKTTLVGLLSGSLRPNAGRIELLGEDITDDASARRVKRGLVRTFQVNSLFPHLTVFQNIFLAASEHLGTSRRLLRTAARQRETIAHTWKVLEILGLVDDAGKKILEIAYGRQRLVEIAIALALEPKVLLLDEPAAGIPSGETPVLLSAIEGLDHDIAILMIEHDVQIVRRFARSVTVLAEGAVIQSGSPEEVMRSPIVRSVYLGKSGHERFAASTLHA